ALAISGIALIAAATTGIMEWPVTVYDGFTGAYIWIRGFRHRWIVVNGHRLHYLVGGPASGFPIVLLHGLGGRDETGLIIAFIRALGHASVDLGGWSMGGWVAQLIAGNAPELVRHLMLFDSAGLHVMPKWNPEVFIPCSPDKPRHLQAIMEPNPRPLPRFLARDILRTCESRNWVVRRALTSMFEGDDVTDDILPTLKMP